MGIDGTALLREIIVDNFAGAGGAGTGIELAIERSVYIRPFYGLIFYIWISEDFRANF